MPYVKIGDFKSIGYKKRLLLYRPCFFLNFCIFKIYKFLPTPSLSNCESVIVPKELQKSKGYHYRVAIINNTTSFHTAAKVSCSCKSFPEFDGRQLNV